MLARYPRDPPDDPPERQTGGNVAGLAWFGLKESPKLALVRESPPDDNKNGKEGKSMNYQAIVTRGSELKK